MAFKAVGFTYLLSLSPTYPLYASKLDFYFSDREETFAYDVPSVWSVPHSLFYPLKTKFLKPRSNSPFFKKTPLVYQLIYCLCPLFL